MHWFEYGRDFYTRFWVAEQFSWRIGVAILFFTLGFIGLHFLRRGLGSPVPDDKAVPPPSAQSFQRVELGGRLYHWTNFAVFVGLFLSGFAIYFPGIVPGVTPTWLWVHVVCAWTFIGLIIMHIIFSFLWAKPSEMWSFKREDWREARETIRYYIGQSKQYPHAAKFNVWQKLYHSLLNLLAILMIGTGITLFIDAMLLTTVAPDYLRVNRLVHDIGAWCFFTVICSHIYVRLLGMNWSTFVGMFTGRIPSTEFRRSHDWGRWKPPSSDHSATDLTHLTGDD